MPERAFCRTRLPRQALRTALTAVTVILVAPAAAQSVVEGEVVASSFRFDGTAPLQADAYLLGFRVDGSDDSAYEWSLDADELTVALTTKHYVAYQETRNDTRYTTHRDASGVLLERYPLAYLMATSARPDDPEATFRLSLDLPPESLEPRSSIDFDSTTEGGAPAPVFAELFDDNPSSTQPVVSYQQPWSNLARMLTDSHGAITLEGNFTLDLFDAVFQVQDHTGTTTYNATYGGWRGIEANGSDQAPPAEWDVHYAQLSLTNATFTFYPAGRPMELALHAAGLDVSGGLILRDVQGQLQDSAGIERELDGHLVELRTTDMRLEAGVLASSQASPDLRLAFNGSLRGATVDGRSLELGQATEPPDTQTQGGMTDKALAWDADWWLLLLAAAGLLATGEALRRTRLVLRARADPEYVARQAGYALNEGHITHARRLSRRVLRHHPEYHEAVAVLAMSHLQRKEHEQALAFLKPYLFGQADEDGALSLIYAVVLRRERGVEHARRFFRKALQFAPSVAEAVRKYPDLANDLVVEPEDASDASYI